MMTGAKGRSGGKREGAGRPPAPSVKGRRIEQGQKFLYHALTDAHEPLDMGHMATITHMTRTMIELRLDDGSLIHLGY